MVGHPHAAAAFAGRPGSSTSARGDRGVRGAVVEAVYDVILNNSLPAHVSTAAPLPGVIALEGDVPSLPPAGGRADAVLRLGTPFHVAEHADRLTAWRQLPAW
jgi:hypothetical protein